MNETRTRNPFQPGLDASRDPSKKEDADTLRSASAASIPNFTGSRGSTGSAPGKPTETLSLERVGAGTPGPRVTGSRGSRRLDFAAINAAALRDLPVLLVRWLPDGRVNGREYEFRNPRRADRHPGSFRVNLRTGRWSDFATGDRGGDPVSLAAFLFNLSQADAARRLVDMLGVS